MAEAMFISYGFFPLIKPFQVYKKKICHLAQDRNKLLTFAILWLLSLQNIDSNT